MQVGANHKLIETFFSLIGQFEWRVRTRLIKSLILTGLSLAAACYWLLSPPPYTVLENLALLLSR